MWRTTKSKIDDLEERVTKLEKPKNGAVAPKSGRFVPALVTNFHEAAFDAASRLVRIGARGKIYRYDDAPRPIFWHWRQIGNDRWQRFDIVTKHDFGPVRRCEDKTPDGHLIVRPPDQAEALRDAVRRVALRPDLGKHVARYILDIHGNGVSVVADVRPMYYDAVIKACNEALMLRPTRRWGPQIGSDRVWADEFVTFDGKEAAARLENLMKSIPPWAETVKLEKRTMTPFTLSVLVHTYYSPEPFHNRNCEAYRRAIRDLTAKQLIEPRHGIGGAHETDSYCATARGNVLVEAMIALPLPVQAEPKWVVPGHKS